MAAETETGLSGNPLILKGLWNPNNSTQSNSVNQESNKTIQKSSETLKNVGQSSMTIDFEEMVLANLRKAEERKRQTNLSPSNEFETKIN